MIVFIKPIQKVFFCLHLQDLQFLCYFLKFVIKILCSYCVQIDVQVLFHGIQFLEHLSRKQYLDQTDPLLVLVLGMVNVQVGYFPAKYDSSCFPNNLFVSPQILFLFLYLTEPTHQLVVPDHKRILHVGPTKLSFIIIHTPHEQMLLHVQGGEIMNVDDFLFSIFKFVLLIMPACVFNKSLQQNVQNRFDLLSFWFGVLRKV